MIFVPNRNYCVKQGNVVPSNLLGIFLLGVRSIPNRSTCCEQTPPFYGQN